MRDLVIVGCGGFGREAADVVRAVNEADGDEGWNLLGFLDDSPSDENLARAERLGHRVLGIDPTIDSLAGAHYVVAISDPRARARLVERCETAGLSPATLVHPGARIGADVTLGAGTIVCGGASFTTNIRAGRHVQVNSNAAIGHDVTIGDFVTITPLVAISGDCTIEDRVFVGTHATVLPRLTVGSGALVGGGACVVRDVPPGATVKGVPAT